MHYCISFPATGYDLAMSQHCYAGAFFARKLSSNSLHSISLKGHLVDKLRRQVHLSKANITFASLVLYIYSLNEAVECTFFTKTTEVKIKFWKQ